MIRTSAEGGRRQQNLAGEVAVHLPQEIVNLLASSLVHRAADGPDEAEDKPEFHHDAQMFCVRDIYLQGNEKRRLGWLIGGSLKNISGGVT